MLKSPACLRMHIQRTTVHYNASDIIHNENKLHLSGLEHPLVQITASLITTYGHLR